MGYYRAADRADRAKAIAGVVVVHAALAAVILSGLNVRMIAENIDALKSFDVVEAPPPPPPPPMREAPRPKDEEGAAGKKSEPAPVVAPRAQMPVPSPVLAAPVAGSGSATTSGAATSGSGPGAGGAGTGRGGGGAGLTAGPQLLSGRPQKSDYRLLKARIEGRKRATMRLTIGSNGRVANCLLVEATGYPDLDARICPYLTPRMLWSPARDALGRPTVSWLDFTITIERTRS